MEIISNEKNITIGKKDISISGDKLVIKYKGKDDLFPFKEISDRLSKATPAQRKNYVLSPAGYGIHWPDVDEDLSVNALLKKRL